MAEFQKIQEAYDALTKPKQNNRQQQQAGNPFTDENHPFRRHGFAWAFRDAAPQNTDFTVQAAISLEQAYEGAELSVTINNKVITIRIPRGVQHGQRLVLEGEGGREHADLPPGNLHVIVMLRSHGVFQWGGDDLLTVKELDVLDLMTGCDIEVTTIAGEKLTVTVPPGSKPSTRLRVPGKGMPVQHQEGRFGSLFIALNPLFPTLTDEQIAKLKEIRKA